MNLAEQYRELALHRILNVGSFSSGWQPRRTAILSALGPKATWTPAKIVGLGSNLQGLFELGAPASGSGRTQSGLSAAGAVWECLVTYYLNLGYAGTDAIAIRKTEVPKPIADALSVWHGARKLAADVDSMVVYLPGLSKEPMASSSRALSTTIENIFGNRFHEVTVVVLACKTSWSDSIQTPMLWNFVYELRRRGPIPGTLSIGSGLFALDGLHSFSYAFITAPSQKKAEFKPDNLPVLRGETMLGGHFWGRPSKQSIAPSVAEFYSRQANRVRIAPLRKVGVALANEARTGAGLVSLTAFDLA